MVASPEKQRDCHDDFESRFEATTFRGQIVGAAQISDLPRQTMPIPAKTAIL